MIKMANRSISEESWVSHLGFIQGVITRMAQNSYLLKGWDATLVAAIFALSLVKSWSFCNFLQARFLLYRSMSIAPSSARSSRWRSSCSRMSR